MSCELTQSFAARFSAIANAMSPLCVGLDPSPFLLSAWGLSADGAGLTEFCDRVLEACQGVAAVVKPQVAFFEAFGPAGFESLKIMIDEAHSREYLVIADAKRGDIGSTAEAYAEAWLGSNSVFGADALTVNPYLGLAALQPIIQKAIDTGTQVFVVVRSSNPEGALLQSARVSEFTVAELLAMEIEGMNAQLRGQTSVAPLGAVVGATLRDEERPLIGMMSSALLLAPGIGAQGASISDACRLFGGAGERVIPSVSRAILLAGPSVAEMRAAIVALSVDARMLRRC